MTPAFAEERFPSIGLALGSGGAAGLAHIAMLEVFDELQIKPRIISGSSIGALIGALYASGLSAGEIRDLFDDFGGSGVDLFSELAWGESGLKLTDVLQTDLDNGGILSSQSILDFIATHMAARSFEDLAIPLRVVATDYWTGEQVILDSGPLLPAIRASMAVPGLFSPEASGERLLIDGGTVNPLPYDLLADHCDTTVAIDVSGTRTRRARAETGPTDIIFNSFEIMQQSITAEKMKRLQPDIHIKPQLEGVRLLHFNRIESILKQARPAANELRRQLTPPQGMSQGQTRE